MPNNAIDNQSTINQSAITSKKTTTPRPSVNVERYQLRLFTLLGSSSALAGTICLIIIASPWCFTNSFIEPIIGLLAAVASSLIIKGFSKSITHQKGFQLLVCTSALNTTMLAAAIIFASYLDISHIRYLIMACGGATCSFLSAFWFSCICHKVEDTQILPFVSCSTLLGFVIALIFIFILPLCLPIFAAFAFLFSLANGFYVFSKSKTQTITNEPADKNLQRKPRISTQSTIMLALNYFQIGICFGAVQTLLDLVVVLAALALGGLLLFFDQRGDRLISERSLSPFSHSLPAIGLLLLCSNVIELRLLALFLLASTFGIIFSLGFSAICEHCRICKLNTTSVISKVDAINFASLGIGLTAGLLIVYFDCFQSPTHFVAIAFGSAYCLIASFVGQDRYPNESILIMGVDPKKLEKSSLQQRCHLLAESNGLSPRQLEVLEMLAVGRNARFIAERLTISQSTAQTHIRTIYTKLNVHSHQEVIDKIMNTKLANED